ncbi:MAG TPA: CsbD family protein [Candidatus Thermoplasmatota archaeon]|nr:CsbD family protein [Candidatus Thermoplasmatota archaeon]
MGEFINRTMGKGKKTAGRATGNRRLQGKGMAQEAKGKLQGTGRKVKRTLRKATNAVRAKSAKRPARSPGRATATRRTRY